MKRRAELPSLILEERKVQVGTDGQERVGEANIDEGGQELSPQIIKEQTA